MHIMVVVTGAGEVLKYYRASVIDRDFYPPNLDTKLDALHIRPIIYVPSVYLVKLIYFIFFL